MFGTIDKSKGLLFVTHDLDYSIRATMQQMQQEVEGLDENQLLNTPPEDLKRYLVDKHGITPITLLRDQWNAHYQDAPVDVRYDRMRWIDDRSRPFMVAGERVEVRIPFEGESELFYAKANTYSLNPPRAVIEKNEIVLRYDTPADQPRDIRALVEQTLKEIEQRLGWQRPMIDAHNQSLPQAAAEAIRQRRERLLAQSQRAEALGIPIRRRSDAPKTYALPTVKRKAVPTLPPTTTAQFKPEPALAMELYEHMLKVVQDMALVMERSPDAFKAMNEEALRQHFLVQLNGQFEGKAT
ncbi:MAG: hypothetical protein ACK5X3_04635, partial [Pseudomonadota bacterium]